MRRIERPKSLLDSDFLKGGAGSGNFGHAGRPGERGGSAPGEGASGSSDGSRVDSAPVRSAAQALLARAKERDPLVTPILENAAKAHGGKMEGLEFRVKTNEKRTREKIIEHMEQANLTADEAAGTINDALRYTAVFEPETYTERVQAMVNDLKKNGLTPLQEKNYWPPPPGPYHGANFVFRDQSGGRFELQFHTPESFKTKQTIHAAYEEFRSAGTPKERRQELWNQMNSQWTRIRIPKNVKSFGVPQAQLSV